MFPVVYLTLDPTLRTWWPHLRLVYTPLPQPPFLSPILFANTPPPLPSPNADSKALLRFVSTLKPKSWMESLFFIALDYGMGGVDGRSASLTLSLSLFHSGFSSLSLSDLLGAGSDMNGEDFLRKYRKGLVWLWNGEGFQIQTSFWVPLRLISGFEPSLSCS